MKNNNLLPSNVKKARVTIEKDSKWSSNTVHTCSIKELHKSIVNLTIMVSQIKNDQHKLLDSFNAWHTDIPNSNNSEFKTFNIKNGLNNAVNRDISVSNNNTALDAQLVNINKSLNSVNSNSIVGSNTELHYDNTWLDPNYKYNKTLINKLTYEQQTLIKTGKYPQYSKIRLIYFKGLRKGKFNNVKLLLFSLGLKPFHIINICFLGKQIFELITKEQYVDYIIISLNQLDISILTDFNPCLHNSYDNSKNNDDLSIKLATEKFRERFINSLNNKARDPLKVPRSIFEMLIKCDHKTINNFLLTTYNSNSFNQNLVSKNQVQQT